MLRTIQSTHSPPLPLGHLPGTSLCLASLTMVSRQRMYQPLRQKETCRTTYPTFKMITRFPPGLKRHTFTFRMPPTFILELRVAHIYTHIHKHRTVLSLRHRMSPVIRCRITVTFNPTPRVFWDRDTRSSRRCSSRRGTGTRLHTLNNLNRKRIAARDRNTIVNNCIHLILPRVRFMRTDIATVQPLKQHRSRTQPLTPPERHTRPLFLTHRRTVLAIASMTARFIFLRCPLLVLHCSHCRASKVRLAEDSQVTSLVLQVSIIKFKTDPSTRLTPCRPSRRSITPGLGRDQMEALRFCVG